MGLRSGDIKHPSLSFPVCEMGVVNIQLTELVHDSLAYKHDIGEDGVMDSQLPAPLQRKPPTPLHRCRCRTGDSAGRGQQLSFAHSFIQLSFPDFVSGNVSGLETQLRTGLIPAIRPFSSVRRKVTDNSSNN